MTTLIGVLARRHGPFVAAGLLVVGLFVLLTAPSYGSTYATDAARRAAVARAQDDGASLLLYGALPSPGTPAQMFSWEIGTLVTLFAALLGLLLAVRVTRASEEDGTVELVRACGLAPAAPLRAGFVVLGGAGAGLGLVCALALLVQAGSVTGVDAAGSLAFAAVVGATFLVTALAVTLLAQVLVGARTVRTVGAAGLLLAFLSRAAGDSLEVEALSWLSPLGLRATVRPFTDDEWSPLLAALVLSLLLVWASERLHRRRELGAGLLPVRARVPGRLRVAGPVGLAWRLALGTTLLWTVGLAVVGAVFTALGAGAVQSARDGLLDDGFLGAQLAGADPAASYLGYTATMFGILASAAALLLVQQAVTDERRGLTEQLRALGTAPSGALRGWVVVAAAASGLALVATGVATAVVVTRLDLGPGRADDAFWQVVGQWPSALALLGLAALVVGVAPRLAWLAWLPYGASVVLVLLGDLLGVPEAMTRWGAFGHLPVGSWTAADLAAPALLVATGAATAVVGLALVRRRDLTTS